MTVAFARLAAVVLAVVVLVRWRAPRPNLAPLLIVSTLTAAGTLVLSGFTGRFPLASSVADGLVVATAALVFGAIILRLRWLEEFRYLTLLAALTLAVLLVFLGAGPAGTDTRINLFGLFQPAEPIKLLVVLFLASYFAGRDVELRRLDAGRWMGLSLPRWRDVLPVTIALAGTLGLFFLQRDLGPALVLYLVFLGLFVAASRRVVLGLSGLAVLLATFWAAYRFRLLGTVSTRIEMWLSPWDNHRPGGVQLAESLWALASGGRWGSGLAHTDVRYIPAGHTDLILAATGETFGLVGVLSLLAALACLVAAMTASWWRARGAYARYLGLGLSLLIGVQAVLIAAGTVGLLPLTGVPMPFVSYGKSALITHFFAIGLLVNLSAHRNEDVPRRGPGRDALLLPALVVAGFVAVGWRSISVMTTNADAVLVRGALTPQADGIRRYSYNRRVLDLANTIPRGAVRDVNGLPLATSRPEDLAAADTSLHGLGLDAPPPIERSRRAYPLGRFAAHVVGHGSVVWADPRTIERASAAALRGYPFAEHIVDVDGRRTVSRDYSGLVPAFRGRFDKGGALDHLIAADRDVHLTLDARVQIAAMRALERNLPTINGVRRTRAAAVVLDPSTGGILAAASLPTYDPNAVADEVDAMFDRDTKAAYDRARFEIYPPGSTFKLVTAIAALESGAHGSTAADGVHACHHVDEIPWTIGQREHVRRVTDDEAEAPHGPIDLQRALVESCNVYFAWIGTRIGPAAMFDTATGRLHLALKGITSPEGFAEFLPDHSYGQARVTVTVLENASVAATIANGGYRVTPTLERAPVAQGFPGPPKHATREVGSPAVARERVLSEATATTLQQWMTQVVTTGTGKRAAVRGLVVGGKTGTAQNESGDRASHAWFVGFAHAAGEPPANSVAFAFLFENGGYGGRVAAQAAHDFLVDWAAMRPVEDR